tara:strand:+ start:681 stop:1424 length:744 start_codon:yes stop_codon:yes gene_type:complete
MDTNNLLIEKNILITGASSGIGKSLAINLSKFGANVIMLSRNEKALDAVYDEIKEKYNTEPMIIKCDLKDLNEIKSQAITDIIAENYSRLDAIIHNAAILEKMSNIENYDLVTWENVLKVNLTSAFILSKYLIPLMKSSLVPRIIFTTSSVGRNAKAFWGAYSVSKAGINALSEILSDELETISNMKVFNFDPKATQTSMRSLAFPAEDRDSQKKPDSLIEYYLWMLSEKSNSSEEIYIEFGQNLKN